MTWLTWFLSDSNRVVATATFALAVAAIAQFELSRRTAKRQLRAYIFLESASLIDGSNIDPPPYVDRKDQAGIWIVIKNTGQTPAKRVLHWADMKVETVDREWSLKSPESLTNTSPNVIPSQGISTKALWTNRQLSEQEKQEIRNGVRAIYLYGRIEYRDAFKRKRWSTYQLKYTNAAWPPYNNSAGMTFCDEGNDAD